MRAGVRWHYSKKTLFWDQGAETKDRKSGKSREDLTIEKYTKLAGGVLIFLKFMWDSPQQHEDGTMPDLDTCMWMGKEERRLRLPQQIMRTMLTFNDTRYTQQDHTN